jgi:3'-phosphoadenosine 5'-phosphosulfate sulfotransferase (PAPS reductase)/FAD synthetase
MKGQLSFIEPEFIRDSDCSVLTPVKLGKPDEPAYGMGKHISPRIAGRTGSSHFERIYLDKLFPLEEYDLIVILFSGGKDSTACYYKLLEMGVPKGKIELWHHDIDGGHPSRRMDWRCTQNYVKSFADVEEVPLRVSYRVNGFFGELYRIGASEPVEWIDPDTGEIMQCKLTPNYIKCQELKEQATEDMEEALKEYGFRMKFPAKSADLSRRWCSAYLKIAVADSVISNLDRLEQLEKLGGKRLKFPAKGSTHQGRWCSGSLKAAVQDSVTSNLDRTKENVKVLVVSGERRGESAGRAMYNEMEIHRTNAEKKAHRIVHQWRPVIDYSEKDIWEVLKRHRANPHPCYRAGWNRCSCAQCIFSTPKLFAGIRELYPEEYAELRQDEIILGFTLDNKCDLDTFVGDTPSCVYHGDRRAIHNLVTGEFTPDDVYVKGDWMYPAGAFHGAEGGPC